MFSIGHYKKVFVEHFDGNKFQNKSEIHNSSSRSFEACFVSALETKLGPQHKPEKDRFFNFLKQKDNFERLAILNETNEVFQAVAEYLTQNPSAFEKLDIGKVSTLVTTHALTKYSMIE